VTAGLALIAAILTAWGRFGQTDLPLAQLLAIPFYIVWKVPVYLKFLVRPQRSWVRTDRTVTREMEP
jgi:hypothetical protein